MLDKKEKVIIVLIKICNLIIVRNGERGRRESILNINVFIYYSKMVRDNV